MGQIIGAALFAGCAFLFGALASRYLKIGTTPSIMLGMGAAVVTMSLAFVAYGFYEDRQRAAWAQANSKRVCLARVDLNADLVKQGKPPLYPNLTAADCR